MTTSRTSPRSASWKSVGIALFALVIVIVFAIVGGNLLGWRADKVGTLSTWVSGSATFAAAAVALYQAHHARVEARQAKLDSQIMALQARWDSERQRRIEVEVERRRIGMNKCIEVLDEIVDVVCAFTEAVRDAAFDFENSTRRTDLSLTTNLRWVKAHPRIGARVLSIADSSFAHTLADKTIPALENLFNHTSVISDASSTDILVNFLPTIDAALEESAEELRLHALKDFILDLDIITEKIEGNMSNRPM